jgi:hypothetical protein
VKPAIFRIKSMKPPIKFTIEQARNDIYPSGFFNIKSYNSSICSFILVALLAKTFPFITRLDVVKRVELSDIF